MCFSPEADLVAGVALGALAVDAIRRHPLRSDLPLALLPAILAVHSLIESLVWYAGRAQDSSAIGTAATYAYLLIAFVVLPTLVPAAIRAREPRAAHRQSLTAMLAVGVAVSVVLLWSILDGPVTTTLHPHYVRYETDIPMPGLVVSAYVLVTCGAALLSSSAAIQWFGVANAIAVAVLVWVNSAALTSLWCGWAVVTSVAIVMQIRHDENQSRGSRPDGVRSMA